MMLHANPKKMIFPKNLRHIVPGNNHACRCARRPGTPEIEDRQGPHARTICLGHTRDRAPIAGRRGDMFVQPCPGEHLPDTLHGRKGCAL